MSLFVNAMAMCFFSPTSFVFLVGCLFMVHAMERKSERAFISFFFFFFSVLHWTKAC
ncbi:MAG: hypothetical protein BYD32DRAFT_420101 [Podila humilis]|nr:MAG: hypothetical protein BYD32DRAFT_420101 [Podila humilis]